MVSLSTLRQFTRDLKLRVREIKDKNGAITWNEHRSLKRWKTYCQQLYRGNMNGNLGNGVYMAYLREKRKPKRLKVLTRRQTWCLNWWKYERRLRRWKNTEAHVRDGWWCWRGADPSAGRWRRKIAPDCGVAWTNVSGFKCNIVTMKK